MWCLIEDLCICTARTFVKNILTTFKVVVFVSNKCEDCMWTTKILAGYVPSLVPVNDFREVELDVNSRLDQEMITYLTELTGCDTVRYEAARIYPVNLEVYQNHIVVECSKAVS
jgi:hypothetical protein